MCGYIHFCLKKCRQKHCVITPWDLSCRREQSFSLTGRRLPSVICRAPPHFPHHEIFLLVLFHSWTVTKLVMQFLLHHHKKGKIEPFFPGKFWNIGSVVRMAEEEVRIWPWLRHDAAITKKWCHQPQRPQGSLPALPSHQQSLPHLETFLRASHGVCGTEPS